MEIFIIACLLSDPTNCRDVKQHVETQQEQSFTTGEHGNAPVYGTLLAECSPQILKIISNTYMMENPGWRVTKSTCKMSAPSHDI